MKNYEDKRADTENAEEVSAADHSKISEFAQKIKDSEVLKPEVMKDMFFGSKINDKQFVPEEDYDVENDPDESNFIFSKSKKQRITADPANDKIIFSIEYMLTPDQVTEGYMLFYNEFVKRSNVKLTLILALIAVMLLFSIILSPKGYVNYLLLLMIAAALAMRWISSLSAKKYALMSADDVKNDSYKLDFYNSRILIQASELAGDKIYNYPPVMIRFEDIDLKVLDYEDLYVLIFKKDYIYTIPKDSMNEEQNEVFKSRLENILGDDYLQFYSRDRAVHKKAEKFKTIINEKLRSDKKV